MKVDQHPAYFEYGEGKQLLVAFHGYGMDGRQFEVLKASLCTQYRIIGFHLPFHHPGLSDYRQWLSMIPNMIRDLLEEKRENQYALAGYSIGALIALNLLSSLPGNIEKVYLFAPFGVSSHWGVDFISRGLGQRFFRLVASSTLPL